MFAVWAAVAEAYNAATLANERAKADAECVRAITKVQDCIALTDPRMRREHTNYPCIRQWIDGNITPGRYRLVRDDA